MFVPCAGAPVIGGVGDCLDASAHPEHLDAEVVERGDGGWRLWRLCTQPELVGVEGGQLGVGGGRTVLVLGRG